MSNSEYPCVERLRDAGVQTRYDLINIVREYRDINNDEPMSYAQIASRWLFEGMSKMTIYRIYKGKVPKVWMKRLGLLRCKPRLRRSINLTDVDSAVNTIIDHGGQEYACNLAFALMAEIERRSKWEKKLPSSIATVP